MANETNEELQRQFDELKAHNILQDLVLRILIHLIDRDRPELRLKEILPDALRYDKNVPPELKDFVEDYLRQIVMREESASELPL